MATRRHIALVLAYLMCVNTFVIAQTDSVATTDAKSRWESLLDFPFLAVPTVAYQPETNFAFGVAGTYVFNCKGQPKVSDLGFDAAYTLNKQWNVNLLSTIYFGGNNRWFMYLRAGFKRYPYYFYGLSNQPSELLEQRIAYTSDNVYFTAQPQYYLNEHWIVGINVNFRWENASTTANLDSIGHICATTGLNKKYIMLGLGALISYDSRDQQFYPSHGCFFKATATYYEPYLGSTYRMGDIAADVRYYVPIYKDFIFACQFTTEWTLGKQKPFQMMPTIGGMDVVRGIRRGEFCDDAMMALQAEFRIPIWRFIKAAAFTSIGDVYNLNHWQWAVPKVGYGVGLRVAINKQKANIRFDVARNNINNSWRSDGWSFYLTFKEAF